MNASEEFFIFLSVIMIIFIIFWYFKIRNKTTEIVIEPFNNLSVEFKDSRYILNPGRTGNNIENYTLEYAGETDKCKIGQTTNWTLGKNVDLQIEWKNGIGFTGSKVSGFVLKRKVCEDYINVSAGGTPTELRVGAGGDINVNDGKKCTVVIDGQWIQQNVEGSNEIEVFAVIPSGRVRVGTMSVSVTKYHLERTLIISEVERIRYVPLLGGLKIKKLNPGTYRMSSGDCIYEFDITVNKQLNITIDGISRDMTDHNFNFYEYSTELIIRNDSDSYVICDRKNLKIVDFNVLNDMAKFAEDLSFVTFKVEPLTGGQVVSAKPTDPNKSAKPTDPSNTTKPCSELVVGDECWRTKGRCKNNIKCDGHIKKYVCTPFSEPSILTCQSRQNCLSSWTPVSAEEKIPEYVTYCVEDRVDPRVGLTGSLILKTKKLTPQILKREFFASGGGKPCTDIDSKRWFVEDVADYEPTCKLISCATKCSELEGKLPPVTQLNPSSIKYYKYTDYLSKSPTWKRQVKDIYAGLKPVITETAKTPTQADQAEEGFNTVLNNMKSTAITGFTTAFKATNPSTAPGVWSGIFSGISSWR